MRGRGATICSGGGVLKHLGQRVCVRPSAVETLRALKLQRGQMWGFAVSAPLRGRGRDTPHSAQTNHLSLSLSLASPRRCIAPPQLQRPTSREITGNYSFSLATWRIMIGDSLVDVWSYYNKYGIAGPTQPTKRYKLSLLIYVYK